ncbi:uncharacterized protein [Drosophila pseudoobscura]|uniref:Protein phosphatase n=1 Tax=Drosophila pseudoobscura pseudoobscura TaxID=46245 RepID=A0A6I8UZR3_DROPS|nr:uncharacterized protein LOC6901761 [Drosophila pseudoobscura]
MDRLVRLNAGIQRMETQLLTFVQMMIGKAASGGGHLIKIVVGGSGLVIRIVISGSGKMLDVVATRSARVVCRARLSFAELVGIAVVRGGNLFDVCCCRGAELFEQACISGDELIARITSIGAMLSADGEDLLEQAFVCGTHVYENAYTNGGRMINQATTTVGTTGSRLAHVLSTGGFRLVSRVTNGGVYLAQRAATFGGRQCMNPLRPLFRGYGRLRELVEEYEQEIIDAGKPETKDIHGWKMYGPKELRLLSVASGIPKKHAAWPRLGQCGEDAWFATSTSRGETLGVAKANGVKSGRICNLSPGDFSYSLMRSCERLAQRPSHDPRRLDVLLHRAHRDVLDVRHPVLASCNTCMLSLDRRTGTVYATNVGGCGFLVVRNGQIAARSRKHLQAFSTQLQGVGAYIYGDPYQAPIQELCVEAGDMLLLGTDGFFNNVDDERVLSLITELDGGTDPRRMHLYAETLALMARATACSNVRAAAGRNLNMDDITIVLAVVN